MICSWISNVEYSLEHWEEFLGLNGPEIRLSTRPQKDSGDKRPSPHTILQHKWGKISVSPLVSAFRLRHHVSGHHTGLRWYCIHLGSRFQLDFLGWVRVLADYYTSLLSKVSIELNIELEKKTYLWSDPHWLNLRRHEVSGIEYHYVKRRICIILVSHVRVLFRQGN